MAKRGRPSKADLAARAAEALALEPGSAPVAQPDEPGTAAAGLGATIEALRVPEDPPSPPVMPPAPPAPPPPPVAEIEQDLSTMLACDREDPRKLWGKALRDFAHARGIARSEMTDWSDEKVREQAKIVAYRQYGYAHFAEV